MRDVHHYLEDILSAIERIDSYTAGFNSSKLQGDSLVYDTVHRNLLVIGEAAKRLPEELKQKSKQVRWRSIAGLRDIIVHDYAGIDFDIITDVVSNNLPELKQQILLLLQK